METRLRRRPLAIAALATTLALAAVAPGLTSVARGAPAAAGSILSVAGSVIDGRQYGFAGDGGPATAAQLYHPRAVAFDRLGNVYIADALNQRIRKIDTSGVIRTLAGNGVEGYGGDGGPALQASFNQPHGVAVDSRGNVYIADSGNNRIRVVTPQGAVRTVAGNGLPGATGDDGPAANAQVKDPKSLFMGPNDQLYIADTGNNRVRKINLATGKISTVAGVTRAGADGDGGPAIRAALNSPRGVWVVGGNVYIADSDNHKIRRVNSDGIISTIAGTGLAGWTGDGGRASDAALYDPRAVAVDSEGRVFIGEETGGRIRRIDRSGIISTIAGNGTAGFAGDGGPAAAAVFDHLRSIALDRSGRLWIADTSNNRVRVIIGAALAPASNAAPPVGVPTTVPPRPRRIGYWMLGMDGKVYPFGQAKALGEAFGALPADAKAVHIEPTHTGNGYWILDSLGNVYAHGDAPNLGGAPKTGLKKGERPVSLSATPRSQGYWIFTNRGRVVPFGDAAHLGDLIDVDLNAGVLRSVATPSGQGYFMVAGDGGVFTFGDAVFRGSMGDKKLNAPVESLVPTSSGLGYWLVATDGGIFSFGDAPFRGSMGSTPLNKPVQGMVRYGAGYLMVAGDGGIFNFSDLAFAGSLGDNPPERPVVAVATLDAA
jgi:sugar lactone lactonase YvrE